MNKSLKTFVIAFSAGILGAWSYQTTYFNNEVISQAPMVESFQKNIPINYSDQAAKTNPNLPVSFVEASEKSMGSVVFIKNFSGTDYRRYSMFDFFFGERGDPQRVSTGSGVIISDDGYIVTNNHVIDRAETIEVVHQKRTYKAELIGVDANTDIAVLKIDADNLPAIKKGSSRDLKIGEWVIAVGNPFNLTSTVTAGIVSAKERQINILGGDFPLESFIQTDAAINPGNSGGALVNIHGELVGINTAILSRTGSYTGYGFAVPIDIATKVANDLIKYGEVQKAIPGVDVVDITPELAEEMQLKSMDGVIVTHVLRNGAAAKSDLQRNDVITEVEGTAIKSKGNFEEALSYFYPGDKVTMDFIRNNNRKTAQLTLQNLEGGTGVIKREFYTSPLLGARLESVNAIERDRLDIPHGIKITGLKRGYLYDLGLGNGFIITQINGKPAKNPSIIGEFLEKHSGKLLLEGVSSNGQPFMQSYNVK
ncbi:MAG: trypsin-like peptidase domain-containing protein [Anditalea sp.]